MTYTDCTETEEVRCRRPSSLKLRAFAASFLAILLIAAGSLFLYVAPENNAVVPSDVLVVLAPQGDRTAYAERLMDQGYAETLAISMPQGMEHAGPNLCDEKRPYKIVCFAPDPVTTKGEARALQKLSQQHGWTSVNVLTAQFHVTRAKVLFERCYEGNLGMIPYQYNLPLLDIQNPGRASWTYHIVYESAAFVKVALNPDC